MYYNKCNHSLAVIHLTITSIYLSFISYHFIHSLLMTHFTNNYFYTWTIACVCILLLWLILHISWLYTKLSVARSRRPSQLVCLGFLAWRPLKILPAGEQTDHYLHVKRRGEGLSKWRKAFFKFNWPSWLWITFHFFLFSSRLIPSLWLFLRSEVVLLPNFTNGWREKTLLLNQGKSSSLANQA